MAFVTEDAVLPVQAAAGATTVTVIAVLPSQESIAAYQATKLSLVSPSLVTGQATNYVTINFRQMRAGASVATIGSLVMNAASVTLPAEVERDVPVIGTPVLLQGDVIDVQCVQTGTGLALPAGILAKFEAA